MAHHLVLLPGFFGFTNWGELRYFGHVQAFLGTACARAGLRVVPHVAATEPTASLPRRAARVAETIAEAARGNDAVSLVGHSSGGLDARLLLTPGVTLPTRVDVEPLARRVRHVVTLSTPHFGTPLAAFFTSLLGQKLLELLSVSTIAALRLGHLPLSALVALVAAFAGAGPRQPSTTLLDGILGELIADFSPRRRRALSGFLTEVAKDRALLPQLTPDGMEVFNACARDRPGVRYGAVVSRARKPGLGSTVAAGLDPAAQATHALYAALHRLTAQADSSRLPRPTRTQSVRLRRAYGRLPDARANDGVVPTRSQLWGTLVHAASGDHLDVLGHFGDRRADPPHVDWLATGSGFDRRRFAALWTDVARFLAA